MPPPGNSLPLAACQNLETNPPGYSFFVFWFMFFFPAAFPITLMSDNLLLLAYSILAVFPPAHLIKSEYLLDMLCTWNVQQPTQKSPCKNHVVLIMIYYMHYSMTSQVFFGLPEKISP